MTPPEVPPRPDEVQTDAEAAESGVRREPDIDRFHALDLGIEAAWGDREFVDVVEMTRESIELLPAFVARRTTELRGGEPVTHHLNAATYGGQTLAAIGDRDTLLELRAAVAREPALAEFLPSADANLKLEATIAHVLAYVAEHPGVIQSKLAQEIGVEKSLASGACYYAAMTERLERSKIGRSYALTIPS